MLEPTDSSRNDALPPLLKWPGGKRGLLRHILPLVPRRPFRYFEPFLGGGALFFVLSPKRATLADKNPELINCYVQVRDNPEAVVRSLSAYENTEHEYYRVRALESINPIERAARMIYLTTLSFNGIYRLNRKGEFNVPYGQKHHLQPCDARRILASSASLQGIELIPGDFEVAVANADKGDFVYFDPPYTVAHSNNGFLKYNAAIFSWADQIRLAERARALTKAGCRVAISNADHPSIRELYDGFALKIVERSSVISAASRFRRLITECIFYNEE